MGILDRLENLIRGAVEGGTNSVLRQPLKPVEIEDHLERAMRDHAQPSRGGKLAPHAYTVLLHPDTFRETIAGMHGYNRHCEMLLNQYATQHSYTLLQPRINVAFDTDGKLGRRDVVVRAGFEAPSPPGQPQRVPHVSHSSARTQVITPSPALDSPWRLQVIRGTDANQVFMLPEGETTVGRSTESDIVLRDAKNTVSRQHAVFIAHAGELHLRDVGSKNGTRVNGNYVPRHLDTLVADGAEIAFGECVMRVSYGSGRGR